MWVTSWPQKIDLAVGCAHQTGDRAGHGGLARSIGTDQGHDPTRRDTERHVEERTIGAIGGTDVLEHQDVATFHRLDVRGHDTPIWPR